MTVKAILDAKGHDVFTLGPNEKLSEAIRLLAEHRIGALVVTNGDRKVVGILSERDIVRVIGKVGAAALDLTVRQVMTPKVNICNEHHTVHEVMEIMTMPKNDFNSMIRCRAGSHVKPGPSRTAAIMRFFGVCSDATNSMSRVR